MAHLPRYALVWLSTTLLAACAGAPPDTRPWSVQTAERLERSLTPERVALAPRQTAKDLEQALHHYALADHQEGQLLCHLELARLYLRSGAAEEARPHVTNASRIAARLSDQGAHFQSALLGARLSNRRVDYEAALAAAVTPIESATVLTYLGRTDEAYRAIQPHLEQAGKAAADGVSVRGILEHIGEPAQPPTVAPARPCATQSCFACVPAQAFHGLGVRCSIAAHPPAWEEEAEPLPLPEPDFQFDQTVSW